VNNQRKSLILRPGHKRETAARVRLEQRNFKRSLQLLWVNRMMVLFTVLVVGIAMAFPTSLLIIARNLQQLAGNWEYDLQVQVYLEKNLSQRDHKTLLAVINNNDSVQSYRLIKAEEGLAEFAEESGLTELVEALGDNPLPDVILVEPIGQDERLLDKLITDLAAAPGVTSASFDQKWAHTLGNFFDLMNLFTSVVLQLLLVGLFVLIAGNVNALVSRSANEIRVIKYIGATDGFVSRPYIYFGAMIGLLGGVTAFTLVVFVLVRAGGIVDNLLSGYGITFQLQVPAWWELLFLLFGPMLLGMFAAVLSCRSAISKAMPDFQ